MWVLEEEEGLEDNEDESNDVGPPVADLLATFGHWGCSGHQLQADVDDMSNTKH